MSSWRRRGYSRKRLKGLVVLKPTCSPARPTWLQLAHEKLDAADGEILERLLELNLDCPPRSLCGYPIVGSSEAITGDGVDRRHQCDEFSWPAKRPRISASCYPHNTAIHLTDRQISRCGAGGVMNELV